MGILFIDLGEVRTFELSGTRTIGRDAKNDIVITHPTVSRHHARIEQSQDGGFVLVDFNSRNGTRVNGKSVQSSEALIDGARMRIGHVRAWFFRNMPAKLPRSISNRDRGIIFNCECGQRLWSASDTAGMAVSCGGCNKSIEVPDQAAVSITDDSSGTVAGVAVVEQPEKQQVICGVCQWQIEKGERGHKCPACAMDFHLDCWRENRGCSAYGCSQVNALAPKPARPAMPEIATAETRAAMEESPNEATAVMASPANVPPPVSRAHVLLALAVVGSLLGLLTFGAPAAIVGLIALGRLLVTRNANRLVLLFSFLIGAVGTGAGIMISRFWWWDQPLF